MPKKAYRFCKAAHSFPKRKKILPRHQRKPGHYFYVRAHRARLCHCCCPPEKSLSGSIQKKSDDRNPFHPFGRFAIGGKPLGKRQPKEEHLRNCHRSRPAIRFLCQFAGGIEQNKDRKSTRLNSSHVRISY